MLNWSVISRDEPGLILTQMWAASARESLLFPATPQNLSLATYSRELLGHLLRHKREVARQEVLVPDFICSTVIDAILSAGCVPVAYTMQLAAGGLAIDEDSIQKKLSPATLAVLFVDYFGVPAAVSDSLLQQLKNARVLRIQDAAHAYLTLVKNRWQSTSRFDATIASIYKSTGSPVGALMLSSQFRIRLRSRFLKTAVCWFKRLLKRRLGRFGIDSESVIYRAIPGQAIDLEAPPEPAPYRPLWLHFLKPERIEDSMRSRTLIAARYFEVLETLSDQGIRPLFPRETLQHAVLMAFPLVCDDSVRRNLICRALQQQNIDAYTWPVFHERIDNRHLWASILLVPLTEDCSVALKKALSIHS